MTPAPWPNLRERRKAKTRAAALAAARTLFARDGFEAATIRGIARQMKMSTGAIFANFPDKAALYAEAMGCPPVRDLPVYRAAPQLLAVAVALDGAWTESFPDGPDGSREYLGGLGHLSDDTVELWRACRAAIAAARGEPERPEEKAAA